MYLHPNLHILALDFIFREKKKKYIEIKDQKKKCSTSVPRILRS